MFSKMEDVELVLRFFAFRQIEKWDNDQLKSFFDNYLKSGNLFDQQVLANLEKMFIETTDLIYDIFGEAAFWLPRERTKGGEPKWVIYEQSTKVLYDSLMYVLSDFLEHKEVLNNKAEQIRVDLDNFYKEQSPLFKGRFNKNDITKRMDLIASYFEETIK